MTRVALEVVKTTRPHQWVKNVFVLAPIVFSEHLDELEPFVRVVAAFLLFCAFSGAVYILNDLLDVEADRAHPVKRDRPIASGRLPIGVARMALGTILVLATAGAFALSPAFAGVALGYFVFNIGYSTVLKHIAFLDVASIAFGFMLRLIGGGLAIDVPLSEWLLLCTFLLSVFLALGKRKAELVAVGEGHEKKQRPVLDKYDLAAVRIAMLACAVLTLASYTTYTVVGQTISSFNPRDLVWTVPCVLFGLLRFVQLTDRLDGGRSPTDVMLRDIPFVANLVLYSAVVLTVIYVAQP